MVTYDEENIKNIISLYENGLTIKEISKKVNISRQNISKLLKDNNIKVCRKVKPFTNEHKATISIAMKGNKNTLGIKKTKLNSYKNMRSHLIFNVDLDWLCKFENIDKLKFLNKIVSNIRKHNKNEPWCDEFYMKFIDKFYYDIRFNKIYDNWIIDFDKWKRPSIDHIDSTDRSNNLSTFQFLTWFENRTKNDIPHERWEKMKENINEYFI